MIRKPRRYGPCDLSGLKAFPIADREHKVHLADLASPAAPDVSLAEFLASLPRTPVTEGLRRLAREVARSVRADAPVVVAFGGHVVKCGLGPVVIDMMERGIVTAVVTHGAGAIHDLELALLGATSEDPARTLQGGRFGMVRETPALLNEAARRGHHLGLGRAVGELILASADRFPHAGYSILATAARLGCTATVHVALGTDTVHMDAEADGGEIGRASLLDFRTLCSVLKDMARGAWLNVGSAVVLPEVFMKAYAVAANLGADLTHMVTANLDQIQHYRPQQNVVRRPTDRGFAFTGHHELLVPLLRHLVLEQLKEE